jgi:hypothetical protein
MTQDKQYLISQINDAFYGVELDGGIGLTEADAIDDYKDEAFRTQCRKNDEKLLWNTIPAVMLNQFYSSLSFFDAKGMRFHLPAFVIAEIKGQFNFGLIFTLTNLSDYSQSQFSLLSPDQKRVIRLFLESLLENPDYVFEKNSIENAVEKYWSK